MGQSDGVIVLEPPAPGESVYEPHIAIDPADPSRMAAVAMYGVPGARAGRSLWCWTSDDAGRNWTGSRVPLAQFDGEGAADPLVAYSADGALLVVGMTIPKVFADAAAAMRYRRGAAPNLDELMQEWANDPAMQEVFTTDTMCVARSEDHGRNWSATMIPNSSGDHPAVAVDTHAGSPHRGNVYVAWKAHSNALAVSASRDGGHRFEPAEEISDHYGATMAQLAVTPDGAVHILWTLMIIVQPDAPADAATAIWHAVSTDGGRSFSAPRVVARHTGPDLIGLPTLGMTPAGAMLLVWGQAAQLPSDPWKQARHRLVGIYSSNRQEWSEPMPLLADGDPASFMGFPAVVASATHWYILAYMATDVETQVVVLRSPLGELRFERWHTLARRAVGGEDIYMHGNYALFRCEDVVKVGDYVGIASHGSTVAAAFTLPATDDWQSTVTAFAAVLGE